MAYTKKNPMLNKGDAVYGEHFNNSALLAGMFSMIGQVNIPSQFESGLFNTTETPEKALFLRITLEKLTGVNNGNNIILNTGESFTLNTKVVLSLFKSWKRFNITGTNVDVEIGLYDENDNLIRNIGNNQELTNFNITDESIKVVVTAESSCTISNVLFEVTTRKWDNNSSVTIPQEQITGLKQTFENQFDTMYPVGIVIEMDNNADPNNTMRGSWELFAKGQFTVGRNPNDVDFNTVGKTGGEKTHKLTVNEMPLHTHVQNSHTHTQNSHNHSQNAHDHTPTDGTNQYNRFVVVDDFYLLSGLSGGGSALQGRRSQRTLASTTATNIATTASNQNTTATNQNTGGDQAHNNIPPYVVVNKWKRIS